MIVLIGGLCLVFFLTVAVIIGVGIWWAGKKNEDLSSLAQALSLTAQPPDGALIWYTGQQQGRFVALAHTQIFVPTARRSVRKTVTRVLTGFYRAGIGSVSVYIPPNPSGTGAQDRAQVRQAEGVELSPLYALADACGGAGLRGRSDAERNLIPPGLPDEANLLIFCDRYGTDATAAELQAVIGQLQTAIQQMESR